MVRSSSVVCKGHIILPAALILRSAVRIKHRIAVVDNTGRVHGIGGLRVVDASIMPTLIRGNTNLPVIMIAEKISAQIYAQV
jgi:hypothetical protein